MRKRKPGYYPPKDKYKVPGDTALDVMTVLCIVLPLLAIIAPTVVFVSAMTPDAMSIWVALPVALIGSTLFLALGIVSSGTDMTDIIVPSIIMIVLSLIMLPVFSRAKANAQWQKNQQVSIQQKPIQAGGK